MTLTDQSPVTTRRYDAAALRRAGGPLLKGLADCRSLKGARSRLLRNLDTLHAASQSAEGDMPAHVLMRVQDSIRALRCVLQERADEVAGFSVAGALWDVARRKRRGDLKGGFFAELIHWCLGAQGLGRFGFLESVQPREDLAGREAALARSDDLDRLWSAVERWMSRYPHGLQAQVRQRRGERRQQVLSALGGRRRDWDDWRWQVANLATTAEQLANIAPLSDSEFQAMRRAVQAGLPVGVTPYYASLMDRSGGDDRAVRAQVIPTGGYVEAMGSEDDRRVACDFMKEHDTSPIDLVTRRYPAIVILKPFNTCPQICVYCQRNWEIREAMARDAMAPRAAIDAAIEWIAAHPAIQEVLVTGGDPLGMADDDIRYVLDGLARIDHVDMIRIGTRTPVTLPMRITPELAELLGSYRKPGRRDLAVMTHVEHPYELTDELVQAVDRLRRQGIGVYNQHVYTYFVSRRFESALLRRLLRRIGIDPYYTFAPKGKEETAAYRVPLARLLQEAKEEARLLPGLRRGDEPVYNVPGLGKNYLRAGQHHRLLSVMGDGSRVYEFHPWEKSIVRCQPVLAIDVPVLDYLDRLAGDGEDPMEYENIYYYF